jgi:hypothetical protein
MAETKRKVVAPSEKPRKRQKRARHQNTENASPLMKLPGELRNRIYEMAIQDSTEEYLRIKHKSIMVTRRYKTGKAWTNAHKQRTYMGLTQACRLLRQESAPLYIRARKVWIFPSSLRPYLTTFAVDDELRELGDALMMTKRPPPVDGGCNLLSMLQLLTNTGIRMRVKKPSDIWWDRSAAMVITTLHRCYESDAPSLWDIDITHVSFDKMSIPVFGFPSPTPSFEVVTVILKSEVLHQAMSEHEKRLYVKDMFSKIGLSLMNSLLFRVRCHGWETLWRVGRNDPMGPKPCRLYTVDENDVGSYREFKYV